MLPTLPQNDPFPSARKAQLCRRQVIFGFTHKYTSEPLPNGIGLSTTVPPEEEFTPDYLLQVAQVEAKLLANHIAIDFESLTGSRSGKPSLTDWLGLTRLVGNKHFLFSTPQKAVTKIANSFPINLTSYEQLFAAIPKPEIIYKLNQGPATQDRVFAWQRIAGANPMVLQGITELSPQSLILSFVQQAIDHLIEFDHPLLSATPPHVLPPNFPITNQQYQAVMGDDDSLEIAAKEGRLYLANYRLLHDLPHGIWSDGVLGVSRKKYVFAPLALFAWQKPTRRELGCFLPVAIQCHQTQVGSKQNPIFTPHDGVKWEMAKAVVQCADGEAQELIYHLGRTHFVMEAVIVAAERNLAEIHPIYVLLKPHFQFTLTLNDYAYRNLIAPGGQVEAVFGSTLSGDLTILLRGMAEYRFSQAAPHQDFHHRSVDNLMGLPEYPYRDDTLLVWQTLKRFVTKYLHLYYANDADVITDHELQDWVSSIGHPTQGNIQGIKPVSTLDQLFEFIAFIIFTASAQHAALNYAQFPMMAYVPNTSGAMYAEAPTTDTEQNEANYLMLLAPIKQAMMQFNILYELSNIRYGKLGHYPSFHFHNPQVPPLVQSFQKELEAVEAEILDRDKTRFLSYPYLLPSQIGNSIFI